MFHKNTQTCSFGHLYATVMKERKKRSVGSHRDMAILRIYTYINT